jgi:hypothetical protein
VRLAQETAGLLNRVPTQESASDHIDANEAIIVAFPMLSRLVYPMGSTTGQCL